MSAILRHGSDNVLPRYNAEVLLKQLLKFQHKGLEEGPGLGPRSLDARQVDILTAYKLFLYKGCDPLKEPPILVHDPTHVPSRYCFPPCVTQTASNRCYTLVCYKYLLLIHPSLNHMGM